MPPAAHNNKTEVEETTEVKGNTGNKAADIRRLWKLAEKFLKGLRSSGRAPIIDLIKYLYETNHCNFGVWLAANRGLVPEVPAGDNATVDLDSICRLLADFEAGAKPGSGAWVRLLASNPTGMASSKVTEIKLQASREVQKGKKAIQTKAWLRSSYRRAWALDESDPAAGSATSAFDALTQHDRLLVTEGETWQSQCDELTKWIRSMQKKNQQLARTSPRATVDRNARKTVRKTTTSAGSAKSMMTEDELFDIKRGEMMEDIQRECDEVRLEAAETEASIKLIKDDVKELRSHLEVFHVNVRKETKEVAELRTKLSRRDLSGKAHNWTWDGSGVHSIVAGEVESYLSHSRGAEELVTTLEKFVRALDPELASKQEMQESFRAATEAMAQQASGVHARKATSSNVPMEATLRGFSIGLLCSPLGQPARHL